MERIETGPLKIGDDWCGVFIRGDDAMLYAILLDNVLKELDPKFTAQGTLLESLMETMHSCREGVGKENTFQKASRVVSPGKIVMRPVVAVDDKP